MRIIWVIAAISAAVILAIKPELDFIDRMCCVLGFLYMALDQLGELAESREGKRT